MEVVWQCESDASRRAVLRRHWPDIWCFEDIRQLHVAGDCDGHFPSFSRCKNCVHAVDVLAGGFPCQPWSSAGLRRGVQDARWLWPEFARLIRLLRPDYVVLENTPGLLRGGIEHVLGDLAAVGFDAEWSVLSACALGAPHTRERLFIVAYANGSNGQARVGFGPVRPRPVPNFSDRARAWSDSVTRSLETSRSDDRETDGSARWLVSAGGNAVVPDVAEWIGRMITAHNDGVEVSA